MRNLGYSPANSLIPVLTLSPRGTLTVPYTAALAVPSTENALGIRLLVFAVRSHQCVWERYMWRGLGPLGGAPAATAAHVVLHYILWPEETITWSVLF